MCGLAVISRDKQAENVFLNEGRNHNASVNVHLYRAG